MELKFIENIPVLQVIMVASIKTFTSIYVKVNLY